MRGFQPPDPEACRQANSHPLCQLARRKLLQVPNADPPNPGVLYLPQLMRWAVEEGDLRLKDPLAERLLVMLDQLEFHSPPDEALRYFLGPEGDPLDPEALQKESPLEVARELWEQLDSRMSVTLPGYRTPITD